MSTLIDTVKSAQFEDGTITVRMASGLEIRFPTGKNPRLRHGSPEQLNHIELSPAGLHWPDLDEDLSIRGLLAGDYGQEDLGRIGCGS